MSAWNRNDDGRDRAVELIRSGISFSAAARLLKIPNARAARFAREAGISPIKGRVSDSWKRQCASCLLKIGFSHMFIRGALRVNQRTVARINDIALIRPRKLPKAAIKRKHWTRLKRKCANCLLRVGFISARIWKMLGLQKHFIADEKRLAGIPSRRINPRYIKAQTKEERARLWKRHARDTLKRDYVVKTLQHLRSSRQSGLSSNDFPPELIELKRELIQIGRELRKVKQCKT